MQPQAGPEVDTLVGFRRINLMNIPFPKTEPHHWNERSRTNGTAMNSTEILLANDYWMIFNLMEQDPDNTENKRNVHFMHMKLHMECI